MAISIFWSRLLGWGVGTGFWLGILNTSSSGFPDDGKIKPSANNEKLLKF